MEIDPNNYQHIDINTNVVNDIVLSYLIHNGYQKSAESFIACTEMKRPADQLENMEKRTRIVYCALEGDTLTAIDLIEQLSHDILNTNMNLLFDLLSLHFVRLVFSKKWLQAVEFAQKNLSHFGKKPAYTDRVEDFMSLLAYENPLECPVFHLTSLDYRQQVADNLNRILIAYFNLPSRSTMETLIRQTTVVTGRLRRKKKGFDPFSLRKFLM